MPASSVADDQQSAPLGGGQHSKEAAMPASRVSAPRAAPRGAACDSHCRTSPQARTAECAARMSAAAAFASLPSSAPGEPSRPAGQPLAVFMCNCKASSSRSGPEGQCPTMCARASAKAPAWGKGGWVPGGRGRNCSSCTAWTQWQMLRPRLKRAPRVGLNGHVACNTACGAHCILHRKAVPRPFHE